MQRAIIVCVLFTEAGRLNEIFAKIVSSTRAVSDKNYKISVHEVTCEQVSFI